MKYKFVLTIILFVFVLPACNFFDEYDVDFPDSEQDLPINLTNAPQLEKTTTPTPSPTTTSAPEITKEILPSSTPSITPSNTPIEENPYLGPVPEHAIVRFGKGNVSTSVVSPDGKQLAIVASTGIYLYATDTSALIQVIPTKGEVNDIAFSKDNRMLAAGLSNNSVELWDLNSGESLTFKGHTDQVMSVAISPDGNIIASASSDLIVILWDVSTGEQISATQDRYPAIFRPDVAFSPDGNILAAKLANLIIFFDVITGEKIQSFSDLPASRSSLNFSPDGSILAYEEMNIIHLWDITSGELLQTIPGYMIDVGNLSFSPNGNILAFESKDSIILWDIDSKDIVQTLSNFTPDDSDITFSPIIHPNGQEHLDFYLFWENDHLKIYTVSYDYDYIYSLALSPNCKTIASGMHNKAVIIWDLVSGYPTQTFSENIKGDVTGVAFSPDGKYLASSFASFYESSTIIWDLSTGKNIQTISGDPMWPLSMAFSSDGSVFVAETTDNTYTLWDPINWQQIQTISIEAGSISISPDGHILAIQSPDGIILWDISSGKEINTLYGHTDEVNSIAFSPDGQMLASGSDDQTIIIWDLKTGQRIQTLSGHSATVLRVAFSPDGKILASGAGTDNPSIILWDITTGKIIETLTGHTSAVRGVEFCSDGNTLVSGSSDGTLIYWDVSDIEIEP